MKKALITGISGQDGYFLSRMLLEKGYEVHGLVRRNSQQSLGSLEQHPADLRDRIRIQWGDITDHPIVDKIIRDEQFDEIYHIAAQSFVGLSFSNPRTTYDINIGGSLNVANAVKEYSPSSRVYFAATSEMFGKARTVPQNEETPFHPRSPYGVSKLAMFWTAKNYRESYNLFFTNGILFNHESEVRGEEFVTRKITMAAVRLARGEGEPLRLGNLEAKRDWGFAGDYVEAMWLMLQQPEPGDYVIATGKDHTVRAFAEKAFACAGIQLVWEGSGLDEVGKDAKSGRVVVAIDPAHYRPAEVEHLIGDASKAARVLGWHPRMTFDELVAHMVEAERGRS